MSIEYQEFIDKNDPRHYAGSPFERKRVTSKTHYDDDESLLAQDNDAKQIERNPQNQRKTSLIELKQRLSLRCSLASLDCDDNDDSEKDTCCCSDQGSLFCCEQFESRIFSWVEANVPKMATPDDKRQEYFAVKRISLRNASFLSNNSTNQRSSMNKPSNNSNEDILESKISSKFQEIPDTLETKSKQFKRLSDPCSLQTQFELPGSSSLLQRRQSQKNSNLKSINSGSNCRNHNTSSLSLAEMKNNFKLHHSHTISEGDH